MKTSITIAPSSSPAGQLEVRWRVDFDRALDTVRRRIAEAGLVVLHEIDTRAIMATAEFEVPRVRQVLSFHPLLMAEVLRNDAAATVPAPLKFTLIERGPTEVEIRTADPAQAFAGFGIDALADRLAGMVRGALPQPEP